MPSKKQTLGEKYNLGPPRNPEILTDEDKAINKKNAERGRHRIKMGKHFMKTENRRYGDDLN